RSARILDAARRRHSLRGRRGDEAALVVPLAARKERRRRLCRPADARVPRASGHSRRGAPGIVTASRWPAFTGRIHPRQRRLERMQVLTRNHRWTLMLVAGALVFSGSIARADEVDRIREKAIELHRDLFTAQLQYAAEGRQSNLARVYKDFDHLLKDNKTKTISQAASAAKDPALQSRLQRLHDFLMGERIRASVAVAWDNARNYDRSSAMSVAGVDGEVTVNSFESMLAGEESRSNRRNVRSDERRGGR